MSRRPNLWANTDMSCGCGKRQYVSKAAARAAATSASRTFGETLRAYKCPNNRRLWHLGHLRPDIPGGNPNSDKRIGLAIKLAKGQK